MKKIIKEDFKLRYGKVIKADNFRWVNLPEGLKATLATVFRMLPK